MNLYWRYRDMSMILLLFVTDEYALLGVISISSLKILSPKLKMKMVHVDIKCGHVNCNELLRTW